MIIDHFVRNWKSGAIHTTGCNAPLRCYLTLFRKGECAHTDIEQDELFFLIRKGRHIILTDRSIALRGVWKVDKVVNPRKSRCGISFLRFLERVDG